MVAADRLARIDQPDVQRGVAGLKRKGDQAPARPAPMIATSQEILAAIALPLPESVADAKGRYHYRRTAVSGASPVAKPPVIFHAARSTIAIRLFSSAA